MKKECVDIRPLLYAYIDNELAGEQSSIVTSHISECESCKAQLASMYRVRDMVKSVYAPKEDIDLSKKIIDDELRVDSLKILNLIINMVKYKLLK